MKLKLLKKIRINSYVFKVLWDKKTGAGNFDYGKEEISIGTRDNERTTFQVLCHELLEIVALEMNVRYHRPDCNTDYLFSYDHRQFETMANMFAGLLWQFIKDGEAKSGDL